MTNLATENDDIPLFSVMMVGKSKTPIIIVDDFLETAKQLVQFAFEQSIFRDVEEAGNFYPGRRAQVPTAYATSAIEALYPILRDVYGHRVSRRANVTLSEFSYVSLDPEVLTKAQCLPHFDATEEKQFAVLHYLCGEEFGGTSFFRHAATGTELVTDQIVNSYTSTLRQELSSIDLPRKYVNQSAPFFERIGGVSAKFNRVVIYPSQLLHSGDIDPFKDVRPYPQHSRLTLSTFIRFETEQM